MPAGMTMCIRDALVLDSFAGVEVVAGEAGLDRELRWVHCMDLPDPLPWVASGQLLLTTGSAWPDSGEGERQLITDLHARGLAGLGIPVDQYLAHFPPPARETADELGFPLLEIPNETVWAELTREVHEVLLDDERGADDTMQLLARLTHAASESPDLQHLTETLSEILARSTTVTSLHGQVLAACSVGNDASVLRKASRAGVFAPELMAALRTTSEFARLQAGEGPVRISAIKELGLERTIALPMSLGGIVVAILWVSEGGERLSSLGLTLCTHAAAVAAIQLSHQRSLSVVQSRLGDGLLKTLLRDGGLETPEELAQARSLGLTPEVSYRVATVAIFDAPDGDAGDAYQRNLRSRLSRRLGQVGAPTAIALSEGRFTFVLPEGVDPEVALTPLLGPRLAAVTSQPHEGFVGLRAGLQEAKLLLRHATTGSLQRFEDLLISRILLGDPDARQPFLDGLLGELRHVRGGDQLVETLLTLATCGFARNRAAAALYLHSNTLRYRLSRITEITGLDLGDPETQFRLQLAARLVNLPVTSESAGT